MGKRLKSSVTTQYSNGSKYDTYHTYSYKGNRVRHSKVRMKDYNVIDSSVTDMMYDNNKRVTWGFVKGVFLLALVVLLGSFFLSGYLHSNYVKSVSEQDFVYSYSSENSGPVVGDKVDIMSFQNASDFFGKFYYFKGGNFYYYDDSYGYYFNYDLKNYKKNNFGYLFSNGVKIDLYIVNIFSGTPYFFSSVYNRSYGFTFSTGELINNSVKSFYFAQKKDNQQLNVFQSKNDYFYMNSDFSDKASLSVSSLNFFKSLFSKFFDCYNDYKTPITYSYNVKYNDYDWSYKLTQLSSLKNIFTPFIPISTYQNSLDNALMNIQEWTNKGYLINDGNEIVIDVSIPIPRDIYHNMKVKITMSKPYKWVCSHYYIDENKFLVRRLDNIDDVYDTTAKEFVTSLINTFTLPLAIVENLFYDIGVLVNFVITW